jgi:hypothetical protein
MKHTKFFLLTIAAGIFLLYSCEDFIEANLSKQSINLISPPNNYVSEKFTLTFKWEDLKGAENYKLQLFKINPLNSQQLFIIDTNVHIAHFGYTLDPGSYKWQVRGENNSSKTEYTTAYFKVDSSTNLSNQLVKLITPADNSFSDKLDQTFTWVAMPTATSYVFKINNELHTVLTTSITYQFSKTGTYTWSVFAENTISKSKTSQATIIIDTLKLLPPTLQKPVNNDTLSLNQLPVSLEWASVNNAAKYNVQISENSTFNAIVKDTVTSNTFIKAYVSRMKYFYWKVRSISSSGIKGEYSPAYIFRVNY